MSDFILEILDLSILCLEDLFIPLIFQNVIFIINFWVEGGSSCLEDKPLVQNLPSEHRFPLCFGGRFSDLLFYLLLRVS
jgi:hypothetical protein